MDLTRFLSIALVAMLAGPVLAQRSGRAPTGPRIPARTSEGHPDFQGVWNYAVLTPLERAPQWTATPFLTREQAAAYQREITDRSNTDRRDPDPGIDVGQETNDFWWERATRFAVVDGKILSSLIVDPPDGRIPALTPDAQRTADARAAASGRAENPEELGLNDRCVGLGGPPILPGEIDGAYLQIVQTREHVVLATETSNSARIVAMASNDRSLSGARWTGEARGRWEGDTLVIETTNFRHGFRIRAHRMDGNLRLLERFTPNGADALLYEVTVEDATVLTRPWTAVVPMVRTGARMFEFACHEGNYSLVHILRGARATEASSRHR